MTDNRIGDEGAKALSEVLKANTTLKKLYLGSEKNEKEGVRTRNACSQVYRECDPR